MGTAMTEWFDELKANYPYMANEIYQKGFEKYFEKEKEQILAAYNNGSQDISLEEKYEPLEYYNKTYNK